VTVDIREVEVTDTHALRRAVLRGGRPDAEVAYAEDELPGTFHLAVVDAGAIVAVSTWAPVQSEHRPGAVAWRLRGMAVDAGRQGGGVGAELLAAAVERLTAAGAEVLWADGRDAALPFYERHGWRVHGEGFVAAGGIPHHVVVLDLAARTGADA
jgi:GNAT superfamily N-acetyltransferase